MSETLQSALLITVMGMGLVFGVILLLWGLIALIVRAGAGRPSAAAEQRAGEDASPEAEELSRRRAAAIAAVTAVTVALQKEAAGGEAKAHAAAAAVGAYLAAERREGREG